MAATAWPDSIVLGPDVSVLPEQLRGLGEGAARLLALLGEPGTLRAALPFDLEVH